MDHYGRNIDYLRLSLTDRCQLKCKYCIPSQTNTCVSNEKLLKTSEIIEIAKVFSKLGVSKIKLTGGEPLLRKDAEMIVASLKTICNIKEVTLTTNGILLEGKINQLASSGLDGINISLDTLNLNRYQTITGKNSLDEVLKGLDNAISRNIKVKINCVLMIDNADTDEIIGIAKLAKDNPVHVRFIEFMPIGRGNYLKTVSESCVQEILSQQFGVLSPVTDKIGNGPAHYVEIKGFKGKIGFISAFSRYFCADCNRVRLSCEGFLKTCLYFNQEVDLKPFLYTKELEKIIIENLKLKPKGHRFNEKQDICREQKNMIQLGG